MLSLHHWHHTTSQQKKTYFGDNASSKQRHGHKTQVWSANSALDLLGALRGTMGHYFLQGRHCESIYTSVSFPTLLTTIGIRELV